VHVIQIEQSHDVWAYSSMCVCAYVCMYVCVCVYARMCARTVLCICVCMCVHTCVYMCVCVRVCLKCVSLKKKPYTKCVKQSVWVYVHMCARLRGSRG